MGKISPNFEPGIGFCRLPEGEKWPPFKADKTKLWYEQPYAFFQAQNELEMKRNVGSINGDGYIGLDCDVPSAFEGLPLAETLHWNTRPGRGAFRFKSNDVAEAIKKLGKEPDYAQALLYKDGAKVGELKFQHTYQVIPPSWKWLDEIKGKYRAKDEKTRRADYELIDDLPPTEISTVWLIEELQKIGIIFTKNPKPAPKQKLNQNLEKLDDIKQQKISEKYAQAALKGEVANVASAIVGERNDQLFKSAAALGELVAADALDEAEVERTLERASTLPSEEKPKTIKSGLQTGKKHPREIPEPTINLPTIHLLEIPEDIKVKAREILEHGDPIQYIVDSCKRMVLGSDNAIKKLICCVAVQQINQSTGLHPKLSGESQMGKSWALLVFAHHLPPEAVVAGSSSNLAGFYHEEGDGIFRIMDDYQAGNETLDTIIKRTSTTYHKRYEHKTVKKQEPIILNIGAEQTWAITSVDSSQEIQVLNRQIPINVDDSKELTRKVNANTIRRYGVGELQFIEDESVRVCREMWRILRAEKYINIRIPFHDRIDWLADSNRRDPSIFMDLMIAITAMNRLQRGKGADGYYLAIEDDFLNAKALFVGKEIEELVHRFTRKEREMADLLARYPEGMTKEELAEKLHVTIGRISQLIHGRKDKGGKGLIDKLEGLEIDETTETRTVTDDLKVSKRKIIITLNGYDPVYGFEDIVRLRSIVTDD